MPTRARVAVSFALAVAVLATFATGQHRDVGLRPAKLRVPDRPMPTVSPSAIERGCAAWGESLGECMIPGDHPYKWDSPTKL